MGPMELISIVIAGVTSIAASVFFIRYTATKSNLEGKDETIETLERSRDAYRERNEELEKTVSKLQGENETLRGIATQTPEILSLTKAVTALTKEVRRSISISATKKL